MAEDNTQGQSGAEDQNQQGAAGQQAAQDVGNTNDQGSGAQGAQAQQASQDREEGKDYFQPFKDQQRRAEKAEQRNKELEAQIGNGQGQPRQQNGQDLSVLEQRTTRAELAANGVRTRTEQDFVIGAAKRLGIEPLDALSDDIVASRLEKMREAQKTQEATPAPSRGGGASRSSGKLPDFSKMSATEFADWERKNRK